MKNAILGLAKLTRSASTAIAYFFPYHGELAIASGVATNGSNKNGNCRNDPDFHRLPSYYNRIQLRQAKLAEREKQMAFELEFISAEEFYMRLHEAD